MAEATVAPEKAQSDLMAGYNKAKGEPEVDLQPVTKGVESVEEVKEEVKGAPKDEPKADPWEGVRKEMEGFKSTLAVIPQLQHELKSHVGRVAAIQREMELAKKIPHTVDAPTQQQIHEASKSLEKWNQLKADFEDWSAGIDERIAERIAADRAEVLKRVPNIDVDALKRDMNAGVAQALATEIKRTREFSKVDMKYPTWDEDVHAPDGGLQPEFAAWMKAQTPEIQALADSERAADAIKMLDIYYEQKKVPERKDKNQERLAAAVTPKAAVSSGPSVLPPEAGLMVGYNRVKRA